MPAREKWWDDVIASDEAAYYANSAAARADTGVKPNGDPKGSPITDMKGKFIWGDRLRLGQADGTAVEVTGRNWHGWMHQRHLGGAALLEFYFIDVGQGDGVLIVTPEGHHLLVDGGNLRANQNGGKNAADFVDWKFSRDYCDLADRGDAEKTAIRLDAMIATHNDIDHFGGLLDLISQDERNRAELDAGSVKVERFYHAGLSWWFDGRDAQGRKKRSLGPVAQGNYTRLIGDRASCLVASEHVEAPDAHFQQQPTLDGSWGQLIAAMTSTKRGSGAPTGIVRLSRSGQDWLPGFAPGEGESALSIRVLGPIDRQVAGGAGLSKFPDGDSKNTNGHSVVLRFDYGERRILLTGDLNTHSQNEIMTEYGADFGAEYVCDVAKGCHHGSHDVSYKFLLGLRPVATVISSGDAETHDHPRPTIVAASALTGRRLIDGDSLVAPMVFMTEVARSVTVTSIGSVSQWAQPQPAYPRQRPTGAAATWKTETELTHLRAFLGSSQKDASDWPRMDKLSAVDGLRYGLVNVRTDGQRLFFAQMEESGGDWAIQTLSAAQIRDAK